jgi:hypothetical protein
MVLVCASLELAARAIDAAATAIDRGQLDPGAVSTSLGRLQTLRRRRIPRTVTRLGWPAHATLARRVAVGGAQR